MPRCVVLLRGVNVGAHNRIAMADFRAALEAAGAAAPQTYLQSGNAVVDAEPDGLADRVADALRARHDLDVAVLVRTADELAAVVAANPFPDRAAAGPTMVHVAFHDEQVDGSLLDSLGTEHRGDRLALGDRAIYLSFAKGSHDSPLQDVLRRLGITATARNWRTVTALLDKARD